MSTIDATEAWTTALVRILTHGHDYAPRGQVAREVLGVALQVDMRRPVVCCAARKLNYRFMAAEAHWMLTGQDDVETLAQYVPRMRQYSDDGLTLAGAYGPRIARQRQYVLETLRKDPDSRQAVLTIWTPNPAPSRDIPCTVSMTFHLREGLLHSHTHMRSSDAWLGLPYDIFTFSMVTYDLCGALGAAPGTLYLSLCNSHLYAGDIGKARACVLEPHTPQHPAPPALWTGQTVEALHHLRQGGGQWWT